MEKWKRIPNFSLYEASTLGRLKTFNWKNQGVEKIMKPSLDNSGYLRTMLKDDSGETKTVKVHRIIAQTFLCNEENKPEVNHKNSIRSDNRVINLEWVTHRENVCHSFANKMQNNIGQNNPCASLTDAQVLEIRRNYTYGRKSKHSKGLNKKEIAKKYNTTFSVIKRVIQNKTWKHLL
jgi:hypothetical protein